MRCAMGIAHRLSQCSLPKPALTKIAIAILAAGLVGACGRAPTPTGADQIASGSRSPVANPTPTPAVTGSCTSTPGPRAYAAMTYVAPRTEAVLFGGQG